MYFVPINNKPRRTFYTTIPVDNVNRFFKIQTNFNPVAEYWEMTVSDGSTDEILAANVPLLRGVYPSSNLLSMYAYAEIGSAYIIPIGDAVQRIDEPNADNLGIEFLLVWGDTIYGG